MGNDASFKARQEQARNHPLREKILALAEGRDGPVDPEWVCLVLPDQPTLREVEYHVSVLREAELLE